METKDITHSFAAECLIKSRYILYLIVILCFSVQNSYGSTDITVRPYEIKFDHDSTSHNDDALTISDEEGDPAPIPEWKYSPSRNDNIAYIKNQTDRKIKVKFDSNCSDMHLIINLTVTTGTGIGEVCNHVIMNYEDLQEITLTLDGTIPSSVDIRQFTWKWEIYAITNESGYCSALSTNYTSHTYYTLLAVPQAPMTEPWSNVLDYACDWASGESIDVNVVAKVTEGAYNNLEVEYDGDWSHAWVPYFDLTDMLSDGWADCQDMSAVVQVFSNALGISGILVKRIDGRFGYKLILPIGLTSWQGGIWNFHQVGYYSNVYDACLKLKASAPRIPVNESLNAEYKNDLYASGTWNPQSSEYYTVVY